MERKTLNYSISLALCLLIILPLGAQNSNRPTANRPPNSRPKTEKKEEKKEEEAPLYNGVSLGVDLWGIGSKLLGGDFFSSEVSVDVNLKNRFFPVVELGYGSTDAWNDKGTHYKSAAPYFRVGIDYNALYKKKHGHMIVVGARLGSSNFEYDIESLSINDPVYGGPENNPNLGDDIWGGNTVPYHHKGMKGSMMWFEFGVGIKAHIAKNLYMGWAIRMKYRLSASSGKYGDPWYVPGFGEYGSNTMGVTYTITYKLPF